MSKLAEAARELLRDYDAREQEAIEAVGDSFVRDEWQQLEALRAALAEEPGEFEVWQDEECVAGTSGPRADALREAMHYAAQYELSGPVKVFEVMRTLIAPTTDRKE